MILGSFGSFAVNVGIVFVLLFAGVLLVRYARRQLKGDGLDQGGLVGFTLQELRALLAEGQLSETEYDAARAIILAEADNLGKAKRISHHDDSDDSAAILMTTMSNLPSA